MMIKPEVLSPAGSMQTLIAAVRSGADAVYLGAQEFNARRGAANFDNDELKQAIDYCHARAVKVYLTLNILIRDDEMQAAVDLAAQCYETGIDGIILQDLGLAEILHNNIPALPLHASTQMSVHSVSALKMLKRLGFCRVVCAREMSEAQLSKLCKSAAELNMEVEAFVHGALCMSVSGQCMLSSMLGTRSGNRGLCAGPCRLPFSLDGKGDCDLSLKDLSLIQHIDKLCKMGVASLKIEGRMKRPEYVAAATAAVKNAVLGREDTKLLSALENVFSRSGFTDGYFTGTVGADMFGVRTSEDAAASKTAFPFIHELYRNERQSIPIDIEVKAISNTPLTVIFKYKDINVCALGDIPETAQNKPTTKEQISALITKLGSTPFFAKTCNIECNDNLFMSAAKLNALRRTATEELISAITDIHRETPSVALEKPDTTQKQSLNYSVRVSNIAQLKNVVWHKNITRVILPLEDIKEGIVLEPNIEKAVDIPRGIEDEDVILKLLKKAFDLGFKTAFCGNLAAVFLAESVGFKCVADFGMNVYNSYTVQTLKNQNISEAVISAELNINSAKDIAAPLNKGIIAYGKLPLMLLRNCPAKAKIGCSKCGKSAFVTDRLGISFRISCRLGFSELFNSVPIYLADKKQDLSDFSFAVLYFTDETPAQVAQIINNYCCNENIPTKSKYTRGLYYRFAE